MVLGLTLRPVTLRSLAAALALETASYPPDEAATEASLRFRLEHAPTFFTAAHDPDGNLAGFVSATLMREPALTEESMSTHHPEGTTLCIHSVVVQPSLRRQGVASWMLREYLARVAAGTHVKCVLLLCKANLEKFYEACGFESKGDSGVVHGSEPWTLMQRSLL